MVLALSQFQAAARESLVAELIWFLRLQQTQLLVLLEQVETAGQGVQLQVAQAVAAVLGGILEQEGQGEQEQFLHHSVPQVAVDQVVAVAAVVAAL